MTASTSSIDIIQGELKILESRIKNCCCDEKLAPYGRFLGCECAWIIAAARSWCHLVTAVKFQEYVRGSFSGVTLLWQEIFMITKRKEGNVTRKEKKKFIWIWKQDFYLFTWVTVIVRCNFCVFSSIMLQTVGEWIWWDRLWLPGNLSWSALEDKEGRVYAKVSHLYASLPCALCLLVVRYLFER